VTRKVVGVFVRFFVCRSIYPFRGICEQRGELQKRLTASPVGAETKGGISLIKRDL
jgi:hypothetical protein